MYQTERELCLLYSRVIRLPNIRSFCSISLSPAGREQHDQEDDAVGNHHHKESFLLLLASPYHQLRRAKENTTMSQPKSSPPRCTCLNADPLDCTCTRYHISRSLASITGPCTCHCHYSPLGVPLSSTEWRMRKKGEYGSDQQTSKKPREGMR
jgi:hypothetical protein